MDITLLQIPQNLQELLETCFNPCFNGYYTSTAIYQEIDLKLLDVSILVLMDITLLPKKIN